MELNDIFNHKFKLKEDELKICVLGIRETTTIDFKYLTQSEPSWKEKCILKPLISFLNSNIEGILILGVTEKNHSPDKIIGVDKNLIRSTEQLANIIKDNIESIPKIKKSFHINCRAFDLSNDKYIYFVKIEPEYSDLFFYSKISNCSYIRQGESSELMSLADCVYLISKRRSAFLSIDLNDESIGIKQGRRYGFCLYNHGTKPSEHCAVKITVKKSDNCKVQFLDTKCNMVHAIDNEPLFLEEINRPVYPGLTVYLGNLNFINYGNIASLTLEVEIFNETHKVIQLMQYEYLNNELSLKNSKFTKLSYLDR